MERHNGIEPDPEGAFVYYADAQATVEALRARLEQVQEERSKYIQAVGLATTCAADMQIDTSHPIEMMQEVCKRFTQRTTEVEALRRELLEWKRALCGLTPGGSEFANDHAYCAEWVRKARENQHDIIISKHRKLKATQAALDAEREKAKNDAMAYRKLSEQWNATELELTQLKALVRALPVLPESDLHLDEVWERLNRGNIDIDLVLNLLRYRATLDATTPAQTDEQRCIEACCERPHDCKWGGTGGCGYEGRKPKGGDGE